MKRMYTMAMVLAMAGAGSAHAGDYKCVKTAHGSAEATLCKNSGDYVLGNATGSGKLILLYPDGKSQVTETDYQDKLGMVVKHPLPQYDKVVFVDQEGGVVGGIGWSESELDILVARNGAERLKRNFVADDNGGFGPKDDNGGFGPKDDNGGFGPKDDNGGFGPKDDNGGFGPKDDNGGFGPKREARVADDNGGFGPKDDNGGFGPKDDNGGFSPKSLILVAHDNGGGSGQGTVAHDNGGGSGQGLVAQGGDGNGGTGLVAPEYNRSFAPKLPNLQGINARCLGTMIFFSN